MTNQASRGHFIVVEGLDRSGKTTQCQMLCEDIGGLDKEVELLKFPNRTTVTGQLINAYLTGKSEQSDEAVHLLFSANRWEAAHGIIEKLKAGYTVVVDRYAFSGAVYSAAKDKANMSLEWCWNPDIGLPVPDLVLFLDLNSEEASKRGGYGEERYEKQEMQIKVRALYKKLFARLEGVNVKVVNAGRPLQEVADQIWQFYKELEKSATVATDLQTLPALTS